jgi:hypothetical protein
MSQTAVSDPVECHSDSEYAERPTALHWEGQRLEVSEILARWRTPDGKHFRVRVRQDWVFELFYDQAQDDWRIVQL